MIWVRLVAAAAVLLVAIRTIVGSRRPAPPDPGRGEHQWGDWPPDQMSL